MSRYSFLLPAYKSKYFRKTLESISSQNYDNFRVIISDDCSPENLYPIVEPFLNDPRFLYRRNKKNIGARELVKHWDSLLDLCDTEFVVFASDDDVYDPEYLTEINKLAEAYPEASVFRPLIRRIDENDNVIMTEKYQGKDLSQGEFVCRWGMGEIMSGFSYYVFNVACLKKMGGIVKYDYAFYSDDITVMKCIGASRIPLTDKVLFSFRQSRFSISSNLPEKIIKRNIYTSSKVCREICGFDLKQKEKESGLRRIRGLAKSYFESSKVSFWLLFFLLFYYDFNLFHLRWRLSVVRKQIKKK